MSQEPWAKRVPLQDGCTYEGEESGAASGRGTVRHGASSQRDGARAALH